jgi:hypothetical protein
MSWYLIHYTRISQLNKHKISPIYYGMTDVSVCALMACYNLLCPFCLPSKTEQPIYTSSPTRSLRESSCTADITRKPHYREHIHTRLYNPLPEMSKIPEARNSVVGCGTMLQAGRSQVRFPTSLEFSFNLIHSSRTMALGSTRNLPGR